MFDRESAAQCHAELQALPRVASGRCRVGVVGMRIDGRTNGAELMRNWADAIGVPFLGVLRETQVYTRVLERGLTIFDVRENQVQADLAQWRGILEWLEPVISPPQAANDGAVIRTTAPATRIASARPENLMPAQESLVHGTRLSGVSAARVEHRATVGTLAGSRTQVPQFLKR
jgi:chromosome partitioning protein